MLSLRDLLVSRGNLFCSVIARVALAIRGNLVLLQKNTNFYFAIARESKR